MTSGTIVVPWCVCISDGMCVPVCLCECSWVCVYVCVSVCVSECVCVFLPEFVGVFVSQGIIDVHATIISKDRVKRRALLVSSKHFVPKKYGRPELSKF